MNNLIPGSQLSQSKKTQKEPFTMADVCDGLEPGISTIANIYSSNTIEHARIQKS